VQRGVRRGDVQRQRQPGTLFDQLVNLSPLALDAFPAEAADQQIVGLVMGKQVHRQRHGALKGDQSGPARAPPGR
jgi:hypothetical protein